MQPSPVPVESKEESAPGKDPVLNLRRDHTYLEMLAEGFRRLAQSLEEDLAVGRERLAEGLEIHRRFLIETHHRKEQALDHVLEGLPGRPYARALADCRTEHERAARAGEELGTLADRLSSGGAAARTALARALRAEADRWMAHLRHEEEEIYAKVHEQIPREAVDALATEIHAIRGETAALEEKLLSWTSAWGPASD